MKKLIAVLSALVMLSALTVPFTAFAEEKNTVVQFDVDPSYLITIPQKVTLNGTYGQPYTGSGTITAEKVFLEEGKKIGITLTSASQFNLKLSDNTNLPYTAKGAAFPELTNKANGGKVAEFAEAGNTTISFTTDTAPQYAGKYTDSVVFTIAIE